MGDGGVGLAKAAHSRIHVAHGADDDGGAGIRAGVDLPRVVDRADVRVMEPARALDLQAEPLGAEGGAELGMEKLERDGAVVLEIAGQIDGSHAAAPDLALEHELTPERVHDVGG